MLEKTITIVVADPWGSLADWVGAVGTAGALILGFLILIGDRRRRQREEADSFTTWHRVFTEKESANGGDTRYMCEVNFYNSGARPIPMASVNYWTGAMYKREIARTGGTQPFVIGPGKSASAKVPFETSMEPRNYYVKFTDNKNVDWYRTVRTSKYVSVRRVKRWRNRATDSSNPWDE